MKSHIEFTREPIVPPAPEFSSREIGAHLDFFGIVRELENDSKIPGLFYEAYEPMARSELEKILRQLTAQYSCEDLVFIHRLDFVPVGEASLFIRICSRHRQAALGLMSELIDRLKADVPIWKSLKK
ncbi:MAG TPA: molybdenum cofactor biosynthesis protein MoaE [Verrucomicrobiae bacterium]